MPGTLTAGCDGCRHPASKNRAPVSFPCYLRLRHRCPRKAPVTTDDRTDRSAATEPDEARLVELLGRLTLEEKVRLLTGRDFWTTWPIEKIGLRRMLFSDGPSGVRGEKWDEREPSLNLPSAT